MINYEETPEFGRDFKKLQKRFKSLGDDMAVVKKAAIELYHIQKIDNRAVFPIPQFCCDTVRFFKIKKFACKALKGRGVQSGIRVIYAYFPDTERVVFLEIYFKQDKADMDLGWARMFFKNNSSGK
jgi:mRNA-degrading endonuclease RelE of RelBE toxin-antitoxin system